MADLIDRQALLEQLDCNDFTVWEDYSRVFDMIDFAPAVEPKCGEWIVHKGAHGKNYTTCSNCNSEIALKLVNGSIERLDMTDANFCPNCGSYNGVRGVEE